MVLTEAQDSVNQQTSDLHRFGASFCHRIQDALLNKPLRGARESDRLDSLDFGEVPI